MLRGLLAGGVWGAVIAVVVLALTSQIADWRDLTPAVTEDIAAAEPGVTTPAAPTEAPGAAPAPETPVADATLPAVSPGDTDAVAAPSLATAPPETPAAPDTAVAQTAPSAESVVAEAPTPETVITATPLSPVAEAPALPRAVPQPEPLIRNDVATGNAPVPPAAPSTAPAPAAPADSNAPQLAQRSLQRPASLDTDVAALPEPEDAAPAPETGLVRQAEAPTANAGSAPVALADAGPRTPTAQAPLAPRGTTPDRAVTADTRPAPVPVERAPVTTADTTPAQPARVTTPATSRVTTVRINRLPTIGGPVGGGEAPAASPETPSEPAAGTEVAALSSDAAPQAETPAPSLPGTANENALPGQSVAGLPGESAAPDGTTPERPTEFEFESLSKVAIVRNAVDFNAPPDQPLLSVIMVDTGDGALDLDQIEQLPFRITVGVDAAADNANDLAQLYRSVGSEIALIPTLPIDGRAQDIAMALSFNIEVVPTAVAILDATGSDFQTDRMATTEVVAAAATSGLGVVTYSRGLNSSRNIAAQAGVPTGLVFRAVDPELTEAPAIGRALDQAAFRARRDGSVIVVMPARQDMLNALVSWSFETQSATVALAPLSAVLDGSGA